MSSGSRAPSGRWLGPAALVGICTAVLAASFLKSDWARNDFERLDNLWLLTLFFVLFLGWCAVYTALYAERPAVSSGVLIATTLLCSVLLWASFPVGSKDVFGYAFYGKLWGVYGANPYRATPADFLQDPWQPFLQVRWRTLPFAYGPLFLWQSWLVSRIAGEHLWAAVWLHKAGAVLCVPAIIGIAAAFMRRSNSAASSLSDLAARSDPSRPPDPSSGALRRVEASGVRAGSGPVESMLAAGPGPREWGWLALLAWNPLLLFESASGAHNDTAMLLLVLAALWCFQTHRRGTALALLAASFWYKWYGLLFVPAFLLEILKTSGTRATLRAAALWAATMAVLGVVLISPLPSTWADVLGSLLHPGAALSGLYPNELSPPLAAIFWSMRAAGLMQSEAGQRAFDLIRYALFFGAVIGILFRQWRSAPSPAALVQSCFLLASAFFMLLITMLLPWHLLTVVGLGILCGREPFLGSAVIVTGLAMLSYFVTFAVATVMLVAVGSALWLLRRWRPARPATPSAPAV